MEQIRRLIISQQWQVRRLSRRTGPTLTAPDGESLHLPAPPLPMPIRAAELIKRLGCAPGVLSVLTHSDGMLKPPLSKKLSKKLQLCHFPRPLPRFFLVPAIKVTDGTERVNGFVCRGIDRGSRAAPNELRRCFPAAAPCVSNPSLNPSRVRGVHIFFFLGS